MTINNYVLCDNVRIYGEISTPLTSSEIDGIKPDSTTEFHLLRHFSQVSEQYTQTLIGKEYAYYEGRKGELKKDIITRAKIEEALQIKGSNFYLQIYDFKNPLELIDSIKTKTKTKLKKTEIFWIAQKSREKSIYVLKYPYSIGKIGVVKIDNLEKKEQKKIKKELRGKVAGDNLYVNVVKGVKASVTNQLVVVLKKEKGIITVLTAYSGIVAPDFPKNDQEKEEREYNRNWWKRHVFVS